MVIKFLLTYGLIGIMICLIGLSTTGSGKLQKILQNAFIAWLVGLFFIINWFIWGMKL